MWADVVVEVDASGEVVWEWHSMDRLDPLVDHLTFNDARHEWGHANTVVPIGDDRVLLSFRNISTVVIIDKSSGEIVHRVGPPLLAQQHDPSILENGNLLVFDNGAHRHDVAIPFSRVLEIDLSTNTPVWSYQTWPLGDLFSPFVGGARRLGNGNTLVTEGTTGRLLQVTAAGEVAWEFKNPFTGTLQPQVFRPNAVFRASHYLPNEVSHLIN